MSDLPNSRAQDIETVLRILPFMYDAALDERRWPEALRTLADWFGAERASAHVFREDTQTLFASYNYGFSQQEIERYNSFEDLAGGDPRTPPALQKPDGTYHCRQLVDDETWYASRMYNEVFKPSGMDFTLAQISFRRDLNLLFSMGIYRGTEDGPFTEADVAKLDQIRPHMGKISEIQLKLKSAALKFEAFESLLEIMNVAVLYTDRDGNLLFANSAAQHILGAENGLVTVKGTLTHTRRELADRIKVHIRDVAVQSISNRPPIVRHIPIDRDGTDLPIQATFRSLEGDREDPISTHISRGVVAVYLMDPLAIYHQDTARLETIFGLTPTEAEVLSDLSDGKSINDIAERSNRSIDTVRTHTKRIMSKLGVQRQADLVRLVLNTNAPIAPPKTPDQ